MTSIVFPGQGSQFVGMSHDFYENFKVAQLTFEEIQDYVKIDLKSIIFDGKDDLINITKYTQISIFAASVAIFKSLQTVEDINENNINFALGHSLGEYTALACSNKLNLHDCSQILKKRGELMNDAVEPNQSGMAALIGKDAHHVAKIIKNNNIDLEIANDNSPIQVVVSGAMSEIIKNKDFFLSNEIKKYVVLNVSSAFHSKYMNEAQKALSQEIDNLNFHTNKINIISNFNAQISNDNKLIIHSLKNQMANSVKWTQSIKKLEEFGEKNIIEIGPNKILSGLIKRISDKFDIKSVGSISDLK